MEGSVETILTFKSSDSHNVQTSALEDSRLILLRESAVSTVSAYSAGVTAWRDKRILVSC